MKQTMRYTEKCDHTDLYNNNGRCETYLRLNVRWIMIKVFKELDFLWN